MKSHDMMDGTELFESLKKAILQFGNENIISLFPILDLHMPKRVSLKFISLEEIYNEK